MRAHGGRTLKLDELDALPDEAVIERLIAVKGFGRWTAEMFLMFRLHRPDVLPAAISGSSSRFSGCTGCASGPTRSAC